MFPEDFPTPNTTDWGPVWLEPRTTLYLLWSCSHYRPPILWKKNGKRWKISGDYFVVYSGLSDNPRGCGVFKNEQWTSIRIPTNQQAAKIKKPKRPNDANCRMKVSTENCGLLLEVGLFVSLDNVCCFWIQWCNTVFIYIYITNTEYVAFVILFLICPTKYSCVLDLSYFYTKKTDSW